MKPLTELLCYKQNTALIYKECDFLVCAEDHMGAVLWNLFARSLTICAHFLCAIQRVQNAWDYFAERQVVYPVGEVVSCGLIRTLHVRLQHSQRMGLHNKFSMAIKQPFSSLIFRSLTSSWFYCNVNRSKISIYTQLKHWCCVSPGSFLRLISCNIIHRKGKLTFMADECR